MTSGLLYRVDEETARRALVLGSMRVKARNEATARRFVERPRYPWQVPPAQPWDVWMMLGGRGTGKTEGGARYVDEHAKGPDCITEGRAPHRIAIVAPSHDDSVDTCVRGETGLLYVNPSIRFRPGSALHADLTWPNGAEAELFGAFTPEDVERFRGPQHCLVWAEEFAAWRKLDESWANLAYGLRLGPHPHTVIGTTPKRRALVKQIHDDPDTKVTTGRTSQAYGLPADRMAKLYARYGGTTAGRQELDAELIEDVEEALWRRAMIAHGPTPVVYPKGIETPDLVRIVVAVDPAVTSKADSDETGIVVVGMGSDGRGYVLDDVSCRASPAEWAKRAVSAMKDHAADRIVAEANNGGDLVSTVIGAVDPYAPVTLVHAARGKRTRAEPVAALYEQGRVSHVHPFPELEDQLCSFTGAVGEDSPDRLDALVWGLSELFSLRAGDDKVWGAGQWGET